MNDRAPETLEGVLVERPTPWVPAIATICIAAVSLCLVLWFSYFHDRESHGWDASLALRCVAGVLAVTAPSIAFFGRTYRRRKALRPLQRITKIGGCAIAATVLLLLTSTFALSLQHQENDENHKSL